MWCEGREGGVVVRCENELEGDSGEWDYGAGCGRDKETVETFEKVC